MDRSPNGSLVKSLQKSQSNKLQTYFIADLSGEISVMTPGEKSPLITFENHGNDRGQIPLRIQGTTSTGGFTRVIWDQLLQLGECQIPGQVPEGAGSLRPHFCPGFTSIVSNYQYSTYMLLAHPQLLGSEYASWANNFQLVSSGLCLTPWPHVRLPRVCLYLDGVV